MWQRKRLYQFGYKLNIYSPITVSDYRGAVRAKNIFQLIANCCQATSGFDPYSRTGASGIIAAKLMERQIGLRNLPELSPVPKTGLYLRGSRRQPKEKRKESWQTSPAARAADRARLTVDWENRRRSRP
jgi:hypothetical protein